MKIVVTGGSGLIGEYAVNELRKAHHEVTVFDIKEPEDKSVAFIKADMLKLDDCRKVLKGAEVIVHLAAIPNAFNDPPEKIMYVNVMGMTNVYVAASELGIKKVIYGSTDSTYGFWFKKQDFLPRYLPLDEEHPLDTQDSYGLSKKIDEEIAANFARSHNIQTISLRIPFVLVPGKTVPAFHYFGFSCYKDVVEKSGIIKDGFWVYIDVRDLAQAIRFAVEAKGLKKYEVFCVCAEDNLTKIDSIELVRKYWSEKIPFRKEVEGRASLMDCSKAKMMLGYRPRHTWRELVED